jgi:hypothetical protein
MIKKLLPILLLAAASALPSAATPILLGIFGDGSGNDDIASVKAAILSSAHIDADIQLYDKSDSGLVLTTFTPTDPSTAKAGTFDVIDNSVLISFITVKAANKFKLYQFTPAVNSGDWDTVGLVNKNGQQLNLGHMSLWTVPGVPGSDTPEPSTLLFLGAGLAGLGVARKFRCS